MRKKKSTKSSTLISGQFLPKNKSMGVFAYQYKKIDDSLMEFGFRIDDVEAKADSIHEIEEFGNATTAGEVHAEGGLTKSFTPKSVSLGLTQDLGEGFRIHSSASYVEERPCFELFTGGVHHTTNLYEQGNVNLKRNWQTLIWGYLMRTVDLNCELIFSKVI